MFDLNLEEIFGCAFSFTWIALWNAPGESPQVLAGDARQWNSDWCTVYESALSMAELLGSGECRGSGWVTVVTGNERQHTRCVRGRPYLTVATRNTPALAIDELSAISAQAA